jgi:hypothetical protein
MGRHIKMIAFTLGQTSEAGGDVRFWDLLHFDYFRWVWRYSLLNTMLMCLPIYVHRAIYGEAYPLEQQAVKKGWLSKYACVGFSPEEIEELSI